ncbi:anthrone oxygenase family protein [Pseudokineococcus sp. 5B2Z-1]|uniref:anthrone oxygenase family protein n=1 Tax=Pseudokineococcus sp. 5B2Z-1 TaxID=3132744 RepID=UPI0030966B4E
MSGAGASGVDLSVVVTSTTVAAAVCTGLVAGLLGGFAVLVMPGLRALGDREHVAAFRAVDGVVQRGSPLFLVAWGGSAVLPVVAAGVRVASDGGPSLALLAGAAAVSLLAVHLPTVAVHLPINRRVQAAGRAAPGAPAAASLRHELEHRWSRWNRVRALAALAALLLLLLALVR